MFGLVYYFLTLVLIPRNNRNPAYCVWIRSENLVKKKSAKISEGKFISRCVSSFNIILLFTWKYYYRYLFEESKQKSTKINDSTHFPDIPVNVPIQKTGYDCAVCVLKNIELLINLWPDSTQEAIANSFTDVFFSGMYTTDAINEMRTCLMTDLKKVC